MRAQGVLGRWKRPKNRIPRVKLRRKHRYPHLRGTPAENSTEKIWFPGPSWHLIPYWLTVLPWRPKVENMKISDAGPGCSRTVETTSKSDSPRKTTSETSVPPPQGYPSRKFHRNNLVSRAQLAAEPLLALIRHYRGDPKLKI